MWVPVGIVGVALVVLVVALIVRVRSQLERVELEQPTDDRAYTPSVRLDLRVAQAVPAIAACTAKVKWSKLQKASNGRTDVGGFVVLGPRHLTWAPDDRARGFGVAPWQVAWSDMGGAGVRTATSTASAVLVLTMPGGASLELSGIDEADALAAVQRISPPSA